MIARPARPQHPGEAGQALVLTAAFAAVLAVMVLFLFGTSQLSNQKTKLQNTADAAAYSAGVLQARDYNFSAYTNRAMVANHVAVAQFTGLESWTDEITKEFKNDPPCIPYITESKCGAAMMATFSAMWDIPHTAAGRASLITRRAFDVEKPLARGLEPLIVALQTAQRAYHVATLAQFVGGAVDGVVKANDPNASVATASFFTTVVAAEIVDWNKYTKNMASQAELKRFANVTVDSAGKDGFTHSRNATPRVTPSLISFVKPLYCPLAEFTEIVMGMTHGGGTQLSTDMTRWTALDAAGVAGEWTCWFYVPPFELVVIGFPVTSLYMDFNAHGGGQAGRNGGFARNGYATPTTNSATTGRSAARSRIRSRCRRPPSATSRVRAAATTSPRTTRVSGSTRTSPSTPRCPRPRSIRPTARRRCRSRCRRPARRSARPRRCCPATTCSSSTTS